MSDEFYLQDSRSYVGNDMLFWAAGGGYTTDMRKAEVFSRDDAQRQHDCRPSDVPWPKAYIDARTRPAVDMQYVRKAEALEGSGITLKAPERRQRERIRCHQCSAFIDESTYYVGQCKRCGAENRP